MREARYKLSLFMIVRPSRCRPRHLTFSLSLLMVVVFVLSFVEEGSDEVENAELYVSRDLT